MSDDSIRKEELRRIFLKKRQSLSRQQTEEKSTKIIEQLIQLKPFKDANVIHSYVSIKKNREVDTRNLINRCFEIGKQVVVPKMMGEGKLEHFRINSLNQLRENSMGVPEPVAGKKMSVVNLDLVVVPMVAGDRFKNRIGYGAGYYDRFLGKCSNPKIGLLFDCQLFDGTLPIEEFDIPLDILITESKQIK